MNVYDDVINIFPKVKKDFPPEKFEKIPAHVCAVLLLSPTVYILASFVQKSALCSPGNYGCMASHGLHAVFFASCLARVDNLDFSFRGNAFCPENSQKIFFKETNLKRVSRNPQVSTSQSRPDLVKGSLLGQCEQMTPSAGPCRGWTSTETCINDLVSSLVMSMNYSSRARESKVKRTVSSDKKFFIEANYFK